MNSSPYADQRFRETIRYFLLWMALVGIAAAIFTALVVRENSRESTFRDVMESYHLRSLLVASEIIEEIKALELDSVKARRAPGELATGARFYPRVQILYTMGTHLEELAQIQDSFGKPMFDAPLERVRARYVRYSAVIALANQGDTEARASMPVRTESLALATEQLRRLHARAANKSLAGLTLLAEQRIRKFAMAASGAVLVLALIAWRILAYLRSAFMREQEILDDLERSRRQLLHSQKVEALGRLAGGIAHDFNNLLTVILTNAELLRDRSDGPMRDTAQEIEQSARRGADLTRQLLTFSRPDAGIPSCINLNEVVTGTEAMLRRLLGEKVALEIRIDPQIGFVQADPGRFGQVLVNLVVNARDAMPEGGSVMIETTRAWMEPKWEYESEDPAKQEAVGLSVYDTGVGIAAETNDWIFEPFFSTKEPAHGTGLGLSTVHGIVTGCGGTISVHSEPGRGARFDILLPCTEGVDAPAIATAEAVPAGGSETIVLVEDQVELRNACATFLREAGYQVYEAMDGKDALHVCSGIETRIDLILTDVVMPSMKGPEMVKRALQLHPEARVLYITGYTDDTALQTGFFRFSSTLLQKPFGRADLLRRVRSSLDAEPRET